MTASTDAPRRYDLIDIGNERRSIYCGTDWALTVPYTDDAGAPIPITAPRMQVRRHGYSTADLILAMGVTTVANVATVTLTATQTTAVTADHGFYDLFATRTDTNAEVKLLYGRVVFVAMISAP